MTTWVRTRLANKLPQSCARCGTHYDTGTARLWRPKDGAKSERDRRTCNECMGKEKTNGANESATSGQIQ